MKILKFGLRKPSADSGLKSSHNTFGSDPGCFLTTACLRAKALPDNCDELEALRNFRDNYLAQMNNGKDEIEEYYRIAPSIVSEIDKLPDAQNIWENIYSELVERCLQMIKGKSFFEAYLYYKAYTLELLFDYCA